MGWKISGYLIFKCRVCGKINMAKENQKIKTCVFCGKKNKLFKVKVLAKAQNQFEAKKTISKLKILDAKSRS